MPEPHKIHAMLRCAMAAMMAAMLVAALPGAAQAKKFESSLVHDGDTRSFTVLAPDIPPPGYLFPVVIVLHGGGGNAASAINMTRFAEKPMREKALLVFPEGSSRLEKKLETWNAGHCCGYAMRNDVDDVGFISALIDVLVRDYNADKRRIYVTGISNGAMMTHRLGIELSDKIAAIAPVVGGLFGDEAKPASPVPALIINGGLDQSIPMAGGQTGGKFARAWDGTPLKPVPYQGTFWAAANGCGKTAKVKTTEDGRVSTWRYACREGAEVERIVVNDSGHAWPSGRKGRSVADEPSDAIDTADVIWEFFRTHQR